jgi:hypothetical protein
MIDLLMKIKSVSDTLALNYGLNINYFLAVYILSILPFYLGYFLILYGSTRKLKFIDVIKFNFKKNIRITFITKSGIVVHLIGRVMPYLYIVLFGKNLPILVYLLISALMVVSAIFIFKKFFRVKVTIEDAHTLSFLKKDVISEIEDSNILWEIYDSTFSILNEISPCKQSLDEEHFREVLKDKTVDKFILYKKDFGIIGLCLTTNDFKNTPWISADYFRKNFPNEYFDKNIYYFIGIAIKKEFRNNRYSIFLIENLIDSIPKNAVIGFDHSKNINPMLHHFTSVVKQANLIQKKHIDQQHYHVVYRK